MNRNRIMLALLFRKGIGFSTDRMALRWSPWSGKVTVGEAQGSFVLRIPTQALKDALEYGHFGDLGITMFTMINLNTRLQPWLVYVFFIVITIHDYEHTASIKQFFAWMKSVLATRAWRLPAPPRRSASREVAA